MVMQKIARLFHMQDSSLIQKSRILRGYFILDSASFVEEDSSFGAPFADNWLRLIDECASFPTDEQTAAEQTGKTLNVKKYMKDSIDASTRLERFVLKTNPKSSPIYKEFGFRNGLSHISQAEMMSYMGNLYIVAKKYKTMLIANGSTEEKIEALNTLAVNLSASDTEQETAKDTRPELTQDRITRLNALYRIDQDVSKVGQKLFKNNPAKSEQYKFVDKPSKVKDDGSNDTPPAPPAQ